MENLLKFKARIEEIAGEWNGDLPGRLEDQAHICEEILEHVKQIEVLIKELEENSL